MHKVRGGTKKGVIASAWQSQQRLQRRDVGAGKEQEFSKHTKGPGGRALQAPGPAGTKAWLIPGLRVAQQAWGTGFVLGCGTVGRDRSRRALFTMRSSLDFLFRPRETIGGI